MKSRIAYFTVGALILAGCSSSGKRPGEANLFEAIFGLSSGEFEEQLESDKQAAAQSRQSLEAQQAQSVVKRSELDAKKTQHDALLAELNTIEQDNQQLEAQIAKMQSNTQAAEREKLKLLQEWETITQKISELKQGRGLNPDNFVEYEAQLQRLRSEVDTLRSIILAQ